MYCRKAFKLLSFLNDLLYKNKTDTKNNVLIKTLNASYDVSVKSSQPDRSLIPLSINCLR